MTVFTPIELAEARKHAQGALKRLKARGTLYSTEETRDEITQLADVAAWAALEAWVAKGRPGSLSTYVYKRVQGDLIDWLRESGGPIRKGAAGLKRVKAGGSPRAEPTEDDVESESPAIEPTEDDVESEPPGEEEPGDSANRPTENIASFNVGTGRIFGEMQSQVERQVFGVPGEYLRKAFSVSDIKGAIEHSVSVKKDRELLLLWLANGDLRAWAELIGQPVTSVRGQLESCIAPLYAALTGGLPATEVTNLPCSEIKAAYAGQPGQPVAEYTRAVANRLAFTFQKQSRMKGEITQKGFASRADHLVHLGQVIAEFDFDILDTKRKRLPPERRSRSEREKYAEACSAYDRLAGPEEDWDGSTPDMGTFADLLRN